jgi:transposase InsO family protein
MRGNTEDRTIVRNYIQKYRFLMGEYELVKTKQHPRFRFAQEFYAFHDTDRRSFLKYYNRFKQSGEDSALLPQKRGPKWKTRRALPEIEQQVIELRSKGMSRHEIVHVLKPTLKDLTPSASGVYNILKRHGVNRLRPAMKEEKRKIIKEKAGELGHVDCHYLSKCLIEGDNKRRYLVCVVDSCTRIAWAEVVEDIQSLTVMFAVLRCLNFITDRYNIRFKEILTDNGPEVGTRDSKRKPEHPFERMLIELGITHRYTRPYRPQTNGKAERFWRTLEDDMLDGTTFDSAEHLRDELLHYLCYYNEYRPHQALDGKTPADFNKSCPRIT